MFTQHPVTQSHRKLQEVVPDGWQMVSPSIGIEVWVEHSDVDGLLDALGGPVIFPVEGLYTLHGETWGSGLPSRCRFSNTMDVIQLGHWCSWFLFQGSSGTMGVAPASNQATPSGSCWVPPKIKTRKVKLVVWCIGLTVRLGKMTGNT